MKKYIMPLAVLGVVAVFLFIAKGLQNNSGRFVGQVVPPEPYGEDQMNEFFGPYDIWKIVATQCVSQCNDQIYVEYKDANNITRKAFNPCGMCQGGDSTCVASDEREACCLSLCGTQTQSMCGNTTPPETKSYNGYGDIIASCPNQPCGGNGVPCCEWQFDQNNPQTPINEYEVSRKKFINRGHKEACGMRACTNCKETVSLNSYSCLDAVYATCAPCELCTTYNPPEPKPGGGFYYNRCENPEFLKNHSLEVDDMDKWCSCGSHSQGSTGSASSSSNPLGNYCKNGWIVTDLDCERDSKTGRTCVVPGVDYGDEDDASSSQGTQGGGPGGGPGNTAGGPSGDDAGGPAGDNGATGNEPCLFNCSSGSSGSQNSATSQGSAGTSASQNSSVSSFGQCAGTQSNPQCGGVCPNGQSCGVIGTDGIDTFECGCIVGSSLSSSTSSSRSSSSVSFSGPSTSSFGFSQSFGSFNSLNSANSFNSFSFGVSSVPGPTCGNGIREQGEDCDNGSYCTQNGSLTCTTNADCRRCLLVSGVPRCGGVPNGQQCITAADCTNVQNFCVYDQELDPTCPTTCRRGISSFSTGNSSRFSQGNSSSFGFSQSSFSQGFSFPGFSSSVGASFPGFSSRQSSFGEFSSYSFGFSFTSTAQSSLVSFPPFFPGTSQSSNPYYDSAPFCGNGFTEGKERCDDANVVSGDGCSATCILEEGGRGCFNDSDCTTGRCMNGSCYPCVTDDECRVGLCQNNICSVPTLVGSAPICGNGILENQEECDDSNIRDLDGCNSTCLLEIGLCGDGKIQKLLSEQCEASLHDPLLPYSCQNCRYVSTLCGDGKLDAGEECDLGQRNSTSPNSECRPDCSRSRCGDGIIDSTELCDDGNRLDNDGCDRSCRITTNFPSQVASIFNNQNITFPNQPNYQGIPFQLPLAQLQPLIQSQGPVGDTGPAAVAVIASGAASGIAWVRKKKK